MTDFDRRFDPSELVGADAPGPTSAELADALGMARELEASVVRMTVEPGPDFTDRVMTAVAAEPVPRPVVALGSALRTGRIGAAAAAFRDTWRVATSGNGRPFAVRAQAAAIVLAVLVGTGSIGAVAAIGVANLLGPDQGPVQVDPTPSPSPTAEPSPTATPIPTASPEPTPSETPDPSDSPEPSDSAEPSTSAGPGPTASGSSTPKPSPTPRPTKTPSPSDDDETPEPSDDH